MKRKPKKKSWHQLAQEKCPKCGSALMTSLFGEGTTGCSCGFKLDKKTKDFLVNRDKQES